MSKIEEYVTIGEGGKVVLPQKVLSRMGLKQGETVMLVEDSKGIRLVRPEVYASDLLKGDLEKISAEDAPRKCNTDLNDLIAELKAEKEN